MHEVKKRFAIRWSAEERMEPEKPAGKGWASGTGRWQNRSRCTAPHRNRWANPKGGVAGVRPDAFDYGKSPYELESVDLRGKTIIRSTRAGTVGATAASAAEQLYLGSFVTAAATVRAIQQQQPDLVSIVAMGYATRQRADEDEQCALYLRNCLQGRQPDPDAVRRLVLVGHEAQKYDDPAQPQFHPQDKDLALDIDRYAFALHVGRDDGLLVARPQPRP